MKIENLTVKYLDKTIYNNFSIDLDNNKVTCIMGPSGCGKTTLLNVISNNTNYEGNITNLLKSAYVFQSPRLINSITVKKNLEFVLEKNNYYKIEDTLKKLQIEKLKDKYPDQISGGEAARVAIARAILFEPELLLLDEPFKDLDYALKHEILNLIKNIISEKKLGCVYVTHDIDEALYLASRVIVLSKDKGQVVLDKNIENLSQLELDEARRQIYNALIK